MRRRIIISIEMYQSFEIHISWLKDWNLRKNISQDRGLDKKRNTNDIFNLDRLVTLIKKFCTSKDYLFRCCWIIRQLNLFHILFTSREISGENKIRYQKRYTLSFEFLIYCILHLLEEKFETKVKFVIRKYIYMFLFEFPSII